MQVLVARMGTAPRYILQLDEERERRRVAIKLLREQIALLEAEEGLLIPMRGQG